VRRTKYHLIAVISLGTTACARPPVPPSASAPIASTVAPTASTTSPARSGKPARPSEARKARCAPEPRVADRFEKSACAKEMKGPAVPILTLSDELLLGECEVRAGRLVDALAAYQSEWSERDPFLTPEPPSKPASIRVKLAERARVVAPRIPQIRFRVHGPAPTVLWIDDDPVAIGTLSSSYGVNPGEHHLVASGRDGMFEETFSVVAGESHVAEMTLGQPPRDWPRWVPHDDLECRLDAMMTEPQAHDSRACDAEKAAALATNTSAEALALAACYERAKLYPLACSAIMEAGFRNPVKEVLSMQHRYDLRHPPPPKLTKEWTDVELTCSATRPRVCPKGWW
jgi:hypothetical protein